MFFVHLVHPVHLVHWVHLAGAGEDVKQQGKPCCEVAALVKQATCVAYEALLRSMDV